MPKFNITNVHVNYGSTHNIAVGWEEGGARYHVWLDRNNTTLYKNPTLRADGKHKRSGDEGYFPTRHLNSNNTINSAMIKEVMNIVEERKLLEVAEAEHLAALEAEEHRMNVRIEGRKRTKRLLLEMRDAAECSTGYELNVQQINDLLQYGGCEELINNEFVEV
jgi:hypothetical protein